MLISILVSIYSKKCVILNNMSLIKIYCRCYHLEVGVGKLQI